MGIKKQVTKQWREFEKLVALIESHLAPKGAVIKSPDHIKDKITGEFREVDASIRYQVGSVPILITIECRDRNSTEDSRWIEQLAQKQNDIGANATIAVSSRKFSTPALRKADIYGIETRLLREIEEAAIRDWANKVEAILHRGIFQLNSIKVEITDNKPFIFPSKTETELQKLGLEYKLIHMVEGNIDVSIKDLLLQNEDLDSTSSQNPGQITVTLPPKSITQVSVSSKFSNLFEDVPISGEIVKKLLRWDFAPSEATILTSQGVKEVKHLFVELHLMYKAYPSNFKRLLSYKSTDSTILNIEERNINLEDGKTIKLTISGKPK